MSRLKDNGSVRHPPAPMTKSSILTRASEIVMRPKRWLWEGHLLRGAQELLTGVPGLGKSQVQIHFVACVTTGRAWPDGAKGGPPANAIMLTAEDVLADEVVPRLVAAGADLDRVHILQAIKTDERTSRQFLLGDDLDELERLVTNLGNVGLITIDPITAFMGGTIDSHKTTEVRAQLGPLKDFAERVDVAVSTITHPPKSPSRNAMDHFIGSQAFIAAGRIGHVCVPETQMGDDGDGHVPTGRVLFANAKNNPHTRMPTLAFRVEEIVVGQDPGMHVNIAAPRVVWDSMPVDISADEAVASAAGGLSAGGQRGAQPEVQEFLISMLANGPVAWETIVAEGEKRQFSERQLKTGKKKLGIVSEKLAFDAGWQWRMDAF